MESENSTTNLIEEINWIADQINSILEEKQKHRYFEGIVLTYTFIENLLIWLVFTQIIWNKSQKEKLTSYEEVKTLKEYCNSLSVYHLLRLALSVDLFDMKLFKKLDEIRAERNSILHKYWLYKHRCNNLILRKKLEKLARVANELVGIFNKLVEETGMDESYGFFDVGRGKTFVII